MKPIPATLLLIPFAVLALTCTGCLYTVAQTPEVLAPGQVTAGAVAAMGEEVGASRERVLTLSDLGIQARAGVFDRFDAGLRLSATAGYSGDVRYQVLRGPILASAGIGASYLPWTHFTTTDWDNEVVKQLGFYPTVLVGTPQVYGGLRVLCTRDWDRCPREGGWMWNDVSNSVSPEAVVGAMLNPAGGRIQLLPEAFIVVHATDRPVWTTWGIGLALQYLFGER
jgi:hypothetical protein